MKTTESPNENHVFPRRTFCRHVAVGLATSLVGGKLLQQLVVTDVAAAEDAGVFILNLADYPVLANVNGSVVFSLPGGPTGLAQIIVTRKENDQFYALDSTCAHNQCTVPPYDPGEDAIVCSCHGSRYEANGDLIFGPAQHGLRAFVATFVPPGQLRIEIPELRFQVLGSKAQPVLGQPRIKLGFPALSFLLYRVRFRQTLQQPWTPVMFARFPNGAIDSTELMGIGTDVEVYVAATSTTGFFSVVAG